MWYKSYVFDVYVIYLYILHICVCAHAQKIGILAPSVFKKQQ